MRNVGRLPEQMAEMPDGEDDQAGGRLNPNGPAKAAQATAGGGIFVGGTVRFRIESGVCVDIALDGRAGVAADVKRERKRLNLRALEGSACHFGPYLREAHRQNAARRDLKVIAKLRNPQWSFPFCCGLTPEKAMRVTRPRQGATEIPRTRSAL